jgi:hypothetical protein
MTNVDYRKYCDLLNSLNKDYLEKLVKEYGLPITNVRNIPKKELCDIMASYLAQYQKQHSVFPQWKQEGGYFDPVLNEQIDDDIQQGADFADDLYDYDANDIDDEDIEDDDDLDEEEYEY